MAQLLLRSSRMLLTKSDLGLAARKTAISIPRLRSLPTVDIEYLSLGRQTWRTILAQGVQARSFETRPRHPRQKRGLVVEMMVGSGMEPPR
jgi:hypothetical protein